MIKRSPIIFKSRVILIISKPWHGLSGNFPHPLNPTPFIYTSMLRISSWFSDQMCIEFQNLLSIHFCWSFFSLSPLSLFSLCQFVSLLSLGAGSWILNPCGLLGGGFFFQIAWQCQKHHRHHQSLKFTQNHHTLLFSLFPFSSFSFSSLIYPTPWTIHPWLPHQHPSKGFS